MCLVNRSYCVIPSLVAGNKKGFGISRSWRSCLWLSHCLPDRACPVSSPHLHTFHTQPFGKCRDHGLWTNMRRATVNKTPVVRPASRTVRSRPLHCISGRNGNFFCSHVPWVKSGPKFTVQFMPFIYF